MEPRVFKEPGHFPGSDKQAVEKNRARFYRKVETYNRPVCKGREFIGKSFEIDGVRFTLQQRAEVINKVRVILPDGLDINDI